MGFYVIPTFCFSAASYGYRVKARVEFNESKNNLFLRPDAMGKPGDPGWVVQKTNQRGCLLSLHLTSHWLNIGAGQLVLASLLLGTKEQGPDRSDSRVLEVLRVERQGTGTLIQGSGWGMSPPWGGEERPGAQHFCIHSCPWCLLRLSLGMAAMRRALLLLLYVSHASASECASLFSLPSRLQLTV